MQVKSVIYLTLAGVVFGVAATWLFIELADGVRRENDARKQALAAMQHKVTQHEEKASQDSLDAVAVTPDLAFFTLHGRVRDVKTDEYILSFTREGKWKNPEAYVSRSGYNLDFRYDKFGYITEGKAKQKFGGKSAEHIKYRWRDGRITKIEGDGELGEYTITLKYDDRGLPSQTKTVVKGDGVEQEIVASYTYTDFDDHGNWTRCTMRSAITTREPEGYYDDETEEFVENPEPTVESVEETQKRKITYYK